MSALSIGNVTLYSENLTRARLRDNIRWAWVSTEMSGRLYPYPVSLGKSICRAPVKSRYAAKFYTCCMPRVTANNLKMHIYWRAENDTLFLIEMNGQCVSQKLHFYRCTIALRSFLYPDVQMYCTRKTTDRSTLPCNIGLQWIKRFFRWVEERRRNLAFSHTCSHNNKTEPNRSKMI